MRLLALAADPGSTLTQVRVSGPLAGGRQAPGVELRLSPLHDTPFAALRQADVVIVERGMSRRHLDLMTAAAASGCAVIYEIDDLLVEPARHLQHADALRRAACWVRASLDAADVVTVSTERLGDLLGLAPDRRVVVPNAAYDGPINAPLPGRQTGPVSLLVAASDRVAGDTAWQALRALQRDRGDAVSVLAVGPVGDDLEQAGVVCRRLPNMTRAAFVQWAASQPNPVAVIPLDDSRFSAGKSAIKWFDYAVAGVPTMASDVPPYRDVMENGHTGWLVGPTQADWQQALARVLADADERDRVAAAARQQVLTHHHVGITRQAWDQAVRLALARAAARRGTSRQTALTSMRQSLQDLGLSVRRWNRERLARRKSTG
ncbi:glycosyltransferase family protein [Leptothrix sp. BB-4]